MPSGTHFVSFGADILCLYILISSGAFVSKFFIHIVVFDSSPSPSKSASPSITPSHPSPTFHRRRRSTVAKTVVRSQRQKPVSAACSSSPSHHTKSASQNASPPLSQLERQKLARDQKRLTSQWRDDVSEATGPTCR